MANNASETGTMPCPGFPDCECGRPHDASDTDDWTESVVRHLAHYLGPDFGDPSPTQMRSWITHAINHLGGIRQDYVAVGAALAQARQRIAELEAAHEEAHGWQFTREEYERQSILCEGNAAAHKAYGRDWLDEEYRRLAALLRDAARHAPSPTATRGTR